MSYSARHKLSDEIQLKCAALFSLPDARIEEECSYPQPFGNAWVVVKIQNLRLRFIWDRNMPYLEVTNTERDGGGYALDQRVIDLTGHDTTVVPLTWEEWSDLFMANYELLKQA
jgi:hypothetical protein